MNGNRSNSVMFTKIKITISLYYIGRYREAFSPKIKPFHLGGKIFKTKEVYKEVKHFILQKDG